MFKVGGHFEVRHMVRDLHTTKAISCLANAIDISKSLISAGRKNLPAMAPVEVVTIMGGA